MNKQRLNQVESQIAYLKQQIIGQLEDIKEASEKLIQLIKQDTFFTSGGTLQNTWKVFHHLGKLDQLSEERDGLIAYGDV